MQEKLKALQDEVDAAFALLTRLVSGFSAWFLCDIMIYSLRLSKIGRS